MGLVDAQFPNLNARRTNHGRITNRINICLCSHTICCLSRMGDNQILWAHQRMESASRPYPTCSVGGTYVKPLRPGDVGGATVSQSAGRCGRYSGPLAAPFAPAILRTSTTEIGRHEWAGPWEVGRTGREGAEGQAALEPHLAYARRLRREAALHGRGPRRFRGCADSAGPRPVPPGRARDDVCGPALDRPPIRRLLDGGRVQRILSQEPRCGADGPLGRFRSGDASRLRQRSSARGGRRGQGRRRDQFRRGHEDPFRRHSARQDERVDDDERRGHSGDGELHRGGGRAGRAGRETVGHHPERHPERVHGAQHLYLSARTFDAHRRRYYRVHGEEDAEVQLDLDFGLSHARGGCDGRAGARLHAGRRHRICARGDGKRIGRRRFRAAPVVLLRYRHELLHGSGEAPGRAASVVGHHEGLRRQESGNR